MRPFTASPLRPSILAGAVLAAALLQACSDSGGDPQLPEVSGLKGTIAFVCEQDDGDNDELCLMSADGSNLRRLTDNPGPDRAPTWNTEGTQLVFNSRRAPHADRPQIYRYDVESGAIQRISDSPLEDQRASWTPDGTAVVFQRGNFTVGYELFSQPIDGGAPIGLTDNPGKINAAGSYAPDGRALLLQSNRDESGLFPFSTYVIDTANGETTRLATDVVASHDGPRWSPTGDRIAFAAGGDLYVIDVATGAVTTITSDDFSDSSPAWSPDGGVLVFQSDRLDEDLTSIHVIDLQSREIGVLGPGRTPVWSAVEF